MAISDPLEILLGHQAWATREMLAACEALTESQWHYKFDMGPGSLHNTLEHIIAAMDSWTHTLAGRPVGPRLDQQNARRTVAELKALHEQINGEFETLARAHPVSDEVTRMRNGVTMTFTRGGILLQVTTHSMHHRAQCLNMLRHLNRPQPQSSVVEWLRATAK